MEIERKLLAVNRAEFKFDSENGTFEGYASVFNGADSYGDTIAPGAYKNTLDGRERPVRMRWNHFGPVIGKWLKLEEDDKGLVVRGQLTPGHSVAEDVRASLMHGAIDGLSIGFYPRGYTEDEEGRRTLTDIELVEISVVEEPADLGARVSNIKARADEVRTLAESERLLRDVAGLSVGEAKLLVSRIRSIACREGEEKAGLRDVVQSFRATLT
jgi:HK97 family phage prohead protease